MGKVEYKVGDRVVRNKAYFGNLSLIGMEDTEGTEEAVLIRQVFKNVWVVELANNRIRNWHEMYFEPNTKLKKALR